MEKQYTINNKKYNLFEGCFYLIKDDIKQLTQDEFLFTLYSEDNDYIGQGYNTVDTSVDGLQIFTYSYDETLGTLVYVNTLAQNYLQLRLNTDDVYELDEYYETETHGRLTK